MDGQDCSAKLNLPKQETRCFGNTGGGLLTSEVSPFRLTFWRDIPDFFLFLHVVYI